MARFSPEALARQADYGSVGGHISWSRTEDRLARLAPAHSSGPGNLAWHARKLGLDPDHLTPTERKRAQNAKTAFYKRLSMKARDARRAKREARDAQRGGNGEASK